METMPHAVHTIRDMATDPVLSRRPVGDTIALPLFWENQKINFAMRFSGYACSHWGTGKENF